MKKLHNIRLSEKEIKSICNAFTDLFPSGDGLWLFGSRVYPDKRGGDIDLYVETSLKDPDQVLQAKLRFSTQIKLAIGDQKIDIVVKYDNTELPIYKIAREEGVRLV